MDEARCVDREDYEAEEDSGAPAPPWLEEKKKYWMAGVLDCFSNIFSLISYDKEEFKTSSDKSEIPMEKITDMFYLGSGAQGVVYGANLDGEKVAVKKVQSQKDTNIKHLLKLNHENIVRFYGVCTNPSFFCIVMEYCQYGSLFDFLHSNTLFMPKQLLKWAKQIAKGMTYLHDHKIIHRDLKSPNILISDNLVVKVSDFGTCRECHDGCQIMTFAGTVAWMAPEVIRHEPCSERVDVWSFGVVVWELFTSEVPYKSLENTAIMWGVGNHVISLPIPKSCPASLRHLMKQCWNRDPQNRPPFKTIVVHLETVGGTLIRMDLETFKNVQAEWRAEIQKGIDNFYAKDDKALSEDSADPVAQRHKDLKQARDLRYLYEKQVSRVNTLFLEVCAVRLQLEQREHTIAEKEKALKNCRCGLRGARQFHRQTSSSSEALKMPLPDRRKKRTEQNPPAQLVVQYDEKKKHAVTSVDDNANSPFNETNSLLQNKTVERPVIELEENGNVVKTTPANDGQNDNYIPRVAKL